MCAPLRNPIRNLHGARREDDTDKRRNLDSWIVCGAALPCRAMSDLDAGIASSGRELVAMLASGCFDDAAASFDEKMTAALPRAQLAAAWASVVASAGAFEDVEGTEVAAVGPYRKATVTCRFARGRIDMEAVYD